MLVLKTKQYEIEEKITLLNEQDEVTYEFDMQLTSDDIKRLQNALFGKDTLKIASKIKSMENKDLSEEEQDKVIELSQKMDKEAVDLIGQLCFKEHKTPFIEKGGESKYEEMVEIIVDFLLIYFISKQTKRTNTITSSLEKIGKN
jgi:hypothetical protein